MGNEFCTIQGLPATASRHFRSGYFADPMAGISSASGGFHFSTGPWKKQSKLATGKNGLEKSKLKRRSPRHSTWKNPSADLASCLTGVEEQIAAVSWFSATQNRVRAGRIFFLTLCPKKIIPLGNLFSPNFGIFKVQGGCPMEKYSATLGLQPKKSVEFLGAEFVGDLQRDKQDLGHWNFIQRCLPPWSQNWFLFFFVYHVRLCCLSCPMNQLEPPEAGLPEKRASYDGKSAWGAEVSLLL